MSLALWHWHLEISSKCTLKCPRCSRTEVPDTLVNTELDLDFFKRNFTKDFVLENVEKITLCGDDGDPIYAHDFIDIIAYFKSIKPLSIIIVTNGSYKDAEFWLKLSKLLDKQDQIHFSIDGPDQKTNEQYRINSDFESIIDGARTIINNSKCVTFWDCIGFKFNEDKIKLMRDMAKNLGFDFFQLTKSTKFASVYKNYGPFDNLEPKNNLISSSHRFEREITPLSGKKIYEPWKKINLNKFKTTKIYNDVKPICHIGNKGLFINSQGEFYPCCWVANRYNHNSMWKDVGEKYNLYSNSLIDVLKNEFWNTKFMDDKFECKTKCHKTVVTKKYATEW